MSNSGNITINKKTLLIGLAIFSVLIFSVFGFISMNNDNSNTLTGNSISNIDQTGNYQEVLLEFVDFRYEMTPSQIIKDVPVRMTVDLNTAFGCYRDILIPEFNVRKYVRPNDNVITFTPTKTGTFTIMCSMDMARGTFQVVESTSGNSNNNNLGNLQKSDSEKNSDEIEGCQVIIPNMNEEANIGCEL
ncbi:MAG: hypothetical protein ACMXYG_06225 [Candidatus Woesearchaeota archaeon]